MNRTAALFGLPIAVVDVETTGLELDARIVEVAVVHMDIGGHPELVLTERVDPEVPIPEGAARVHGITDEDVADAPTWDAVAPRVLRSLEGRLPCAYNAPADYRWLRAECERVGLELAPAWPWLDAYVPARVVDRYERGKRLQQVASRRGIEVDAHGAAGDAFTTALLLGRLLDEAHIGQAWPLGGYLDWQRENALREEASFVTWMVNARRTAGDRPSCAWHELEGVTPPPWPERKAQGRCPQCRGPAVHRVSQAGHLALEDPDGGPHVCA